jgi:hypothetical protein
MADEASTRELRGRAQLDDSRLLEGNAVQHINRAPDFVRVGLRFLEHLCVRRSPLRRHTATPILHRGALRRCHLAARD